MRQQRIGGLVEFLIVKKNLRVLAQKFAGGTALLRQQPARNGVHEYNFIMPRFGKLEDYWHGELDPDGQPAVPATAPEPFSGRDKLLQEYFRALVPQRIRPQCIERDSLIELTKSEASLLIEDFRTEFSRGER